MIKQYFPQLILFSIKLIQQYHNKRCGQRAGVGNKMSVQKTQPEGKSQSIASRSEGLNLEGSPTYSVAI